MESVWKHLDEPESSLFFSRSDETDPRMGDVVRHGRKNQTGHVQVGIVGVPDDEGVKRNRGRTGAKDAPDEIRKAFYRLTPFAGLKERPVTELSIFDYGNIQIASTLEETHNRVEALVQELTGRGTVVALLGGGHDLTYPGFAGASAKNQKMGAIGIDAHVCFRRLISQRNSGTPYRQLLDSPQRLLLPMNLVLMGMKPYLNSREHYEELIERGATVFSIGEIQREGLAKILDLAYEIATGSTDRLYVSFDPGAVRSSEAPGVNQPHPAGMTAEQFLGAARFFGQRKKTCAIEIVEVNPRTDVAGATAELAALVLLQFLAGFANR